MKHIIFLFTFFMTSYAMAAVPALPMGLDDSSSSFSSDSFEDSVWDNFEFDSFLDVRAGTRLYDQDLQSDTSLAEVRLQTGVSYEGDLLSANLVADFIYDDVDRDMDQNFQTGTGSIDLREANFSFTPFDFMDVKIGRQVLTWGVGDMVFINDLFPKDWNAFFIGRDVEYLKAPSDAIKMSLFSSVANLDLVYMPRHDASRYIDGRRISYYDAMTQSESNTVVDAMRQTDDEFTLRLYQSVGSVELAAYYFDGFWKEPEGFDIVAGKAMYPALRVYGLSMRSPFGPGILSSEFGYYDSLDDAHGTDPLIRNSESRFLLGYEQEAAQNFTVGVQYYTEIMDHYTGYQLSSDPTGYIKDHVREMWTLRLTYLAMNQNLILSLFNYYSPTDKDGYIRPKVTYKQSDNLQFEVGGNIFFGETQILPSGTEAQPTFWGQFENASNAFVAVRYTF